MTSAQKISWEEQEFVEVRPGIFGATIHTPQLTVTLYRYGAGSSWEEHQHPQDQVTLVLDGMIYFRVDSRSVPLGKGELATIPAGTVHGATVPDSGGVVTLNVFTRRDGSP